MNNRNSSYAVTARQYEIRSEDQNEIMNTGLILGQCRRQECQQQWRNSATTNVGRTNDKCRGASLTNEKQVHRAYMRANTDMLEKAVCDDKGGLALMEILDYA